MEQPKGSKIIVKRSQERLEFYVPPVGFFSYPTVFVIVFDLILVAILALLGLPFLDAEFKLVVTPLNITILPFALPLIFLGVSLAVGLLLPTWFQKTYLSLDQEQITLERVMFEKVTEHTALPRLTVEKLNRIPSRIDGEFELPCKLVIVAGEDEICIRCEPPLSKGEFEWLAHEVSAWLNLPVCEINQQHQTNT
jgi:hypothetical protein